MLSCGCRRLKRSTSQRVTVLPARFLKPWEVLEMDIHDIGARSEAGNKHLLVIVDRASKFLFACPLPKETAKKAAKKLLARSPPQTLSNTSANGSTRRSIWPYRPPKSSEGWGRGWGGGSMKLLWSFGHPFPLTIRPRLPYPDGCYLTKPRRRGHGRTA